MAAQGQALQGIDHHLSTDPHGAAAEIRRLGGHKDIVQVLASHGSQRPYGDPFYHPIFEACAEVGLPFAIHFGGQGGVNHNAVASGPTAYYWETHALLSQPAMTHVVSMISNGVFEKYPELYFVVIECGVSWVPSLMWRLDANFKALRKETPWLKMLPSEYCRRNIRFSTQPLEQPKNVKHLVGNTRAHGRPEHPAVCVRLSALGLRRAD